MKRIQIYLSDGQQAEFDRFRAAIQEMAGAVPRLPPGAEFVDEIRTANVNRHEEIERRRRR